MYRNVKVNNQTRQNIVFDLVQILNSSPVFVQGPENDATWRYLKTISVSVTDRLGIYPVGEWQVDTVLNHIANEASYLYHCDVEATRDALGMHFEFTLRERDFRVTQMVCFGRMFQRGNRIEPIPWIILEQNAESALLLSKYALLTRGYWLDFYCDQILDQGKRLFWEYSNFREWLNGTFCTLAFTEDERNALCDTLIRTGANVPMDLQRNKVFLLTPEEVQRYLPTRDERKAQPTDFAVFGGAEKVGEHCCWWLLPHYHELTGQMQLQAVMGNGEIWSIEKNNAHSNWCVRPAVRLKAEALQKLNVWGDTAGKKNPNEKCYPLDQTELYFLRVFYEDGAVAKVSVDVEAANDSHYELGVAAAKQLQDLLQQKYGQRDLVSLLREFFRTESEYRLVSLMNQNGIRYASFHF